MKKLLMLAKQSTYSTVITGLAAILLIVCASLTMAKNSSAAPHYLIAADQESAQPISLEAGAKPLKVSEIASAPLEADLLTQSPHNNCIYDLIKNTQPTSNYTPNNTYNLSFIYGGYGSTTAPGLNGFYDINGDSLPDYIYTSNASYAANVGGVPGQENLFATCIYLNNGQGWTKAYRCYASTTVSSEGGQVLSAVYYGDCAS